MAGAGSAVDGFINCESAAVLVAGHRIAGSAVSSAHWIWSALAYHAAFFTRINPAAWVFAALFLLLRAFFWRGSCKDDRSPLAQRVGASGVGPDRV